MNLDKVQSRLGYVFADESLLKRALTHASFGDGQNRDQSYERLEFLGDRVLGLLTAERLFRDFRDAREGALAPRLNALVSRKACAKVARRFDLGHVIRLGKSEEAHNGRNNESILGDVMEAVLAAVYLDGGLGAAKELYEKGWDADIDAIAHKPANPKSELQESLAKRGLMPRYDLAEQGGPDHKPVFTVHVFVDGYDPAFGEGGSKQAAERAAAQAFLEREFKR
tara:strand:+ start:883 stop:1557 length:675 start_codon:yes stop_codon:yes gene_type:complete